MGNETGMINCSCRKGSGACDLARSLMARIKELEEESRRKSALIESVSAVNVSLAETVAKQADALARDRHATREMLREKPIAVVTARQAEATDNHEDPQTAQSNMGTTAAANLEGPARARSSSNLIG